MITVHREKISKFSGFLTQGAFEESPGRSKREGFVDFDAIPNLMRDFAQNLGRGFNNMVQQGQNLGQRY